MSEKILIVDDEVEIADLIEIRSIKLHRISSLAGDKRFEHLRTVLETVMLPLHQSPISRVASYPLS